MFTEKPVRGFDEKHTSGYPPRAGGISPSLNGGSKREDSSVEGPTGMSVPACILISSMTLGKRNLPLSVFFAHIGSRVSSGGPFKSASPGDP